MLQADVGELGAGLDSATRALEISRTIEPPMGTGADAQSERARLQMELSTSHGTVGAILSSRHDSRAAAEHLREQGRLLETLPAELRDSPQTRRDRSAAYENFGLALLDLGDLEGALVQVRRARAMRAELVAQHPDNADYRRILGVACYNEAELLDNLGRLDEALASYRQNVEIAEALHEADPANEQSRSDLAFALTRTGDVLSKQGQPVAALEPYRRSQSLRSSDVASDPTNTVKRAALIENTAAIAATLAALGDRNAAREAADEALDLIDGTTVDPLNAQVRLALAGVHAELGETYLRLAERGGAAEPERGRDRRAACEQFAQSDAIWRALRDRDLLPAGDPPEVAELAARLRECPAANRAR